MPVRGTIGIDVGGTKTLAALFDEKFTVLEEVKFKTQPEKDEKNFTANLTDSIEQLNHQAKKKEVSIVGVGIGCAGLVDREKRTLKVSPNIPFLKDYPFGQRLSKLTGSNVFIANDVHMGLYGEHRLGAAVGLEHVIGVFFGTGLGGAVIINGQLHLGASGGAGDIGHYMVSPIGPLSGSERQGALDDFVSRGAIAGAAAAIASKQWAPHLRELAGTDVNEMTSGVLAESIKRGDKKIEELVRARAHMAGIALSNLVDFLSPEMVVLGGGLVDAMPALFLKEVGEGIRTHACVDVQGTYKVAVTKLKDHAVTTGAATMAWDLFSG